MIARYSRPEMTGIWSEESKFARWLEVELAALDGWAELGSIPATDVAAIRTHARPPSPQRVAEIEQVTDHDTAAFVDAVAEQLGPEGRWFHYGLTSSDVVDTALSLQIQDAGRLILEGIDRALAAVVSRAEGSAGGRPSTRSWSFSQARSVTDPPPRMMHTASNGRRFLWWPYRSFAAPQIEAEASDPGTPRRNSETRTARGGGAARPRA